jgi:zinc/manganese transport system substrate-binding protein
MVKKIKIVSSSFWVAFWLNFLMSTLPSYAQHQESIPPITVVTSFSILKEWVEILVSGIKPNGHTIDVMSLVPLTQDPHTYQPTPNDLMILSKAKLIFVIGLSFEGWFDSLFTHATSQGIVIKVADSLPHLRTDPMPDPNVWHDVGYARMMLKTMKDMLCIHFPSESARITDNYRQYDQRLSALDTWVKDQFKTIPIQARTVLTTHDAFYYYGRAYTVTFLSPQGISTEDDVSAKTISTLIEDIRSKHIHAIFFEKLASRQLIQQIVDETGMYINENNILYADSLSDSNESASTYCTLIEHNTNMIISAFKKSYFHTDGGHTKKLDK